MLSLLISLDPYLTSPSLHGLNPSPNPWESHFEHAFVACMKSNIRSDSCLSPFSNGPLTATSCNPCGSLSFSVRHRWKLQKRQHGSGDPQMSCHSHVRAVIDVKEGVFALQLGSTAMFSILQWIESKEVAFIGMAKGPHGQAKLHSNFLNLTVDSVYG